MATETETETETVTATATETVTGTGSATVTVTATATVTGTGTGFATGTETGSPTGTGTATGSPTDTGTATGSPTDTGTATATGSATETVTGTGTGSGAVPVAGSASGAGAAGPADVAALRASCTRFLHGHVPVRPADELAALAAWCREHDVGADSYGSGEHIAGFERSVAARLGFPAALFVPSGTAAQQIALRIWCERAGRPHIAFHPTCHLELHEQRGYDHLHHLRATWIGERHRPVRAGDLAALAEAPAVALIELPLREIGGQLPTWDELAALRASAAARGVRLHLDGARLWETRAWFGQRDYADICRGFDSVYVSLYKGVGAIAGSVLAGPADFVAEARVWLRRHGCNLVHNYPMVASAAKNLDERLSLMPAWHARAHELAAALRALPRVRVRPDPPHVNLFHLYLDAPLERVWDAHLRIAREDRLWLLGRLRPCDVPGYCATEIYVGTAAMQLTVAEVVRAFEKLAALLEAGAPGAGTGADAGVEPP